ncbi:Outer membrane efflux protein [Arcobacter porcinus]|uniref:TolC family protein n=1 Tax=Arcobacter porcinus TaxID=1935204 RepID=UPI000825A784|nr:TolC family protein [Arcobacter porcinus]OCL82642.1 Outer membrane efflux protein [Arcobacter porcinus]
MKKIYFVFLLPLFLYSQNLEELINLSIENRLVESTKQRVDALKEDYKGTKSAYLPQFNVGAKYYINDNEYSYLGISKKGFNAYGSVDFIVYDGGKRGDTFDIYESSIKSQEQSLEALKNDISLSVVNYYYNYLSLDARKDAKQREIEQLTAQKNRIEKFYEAGTATEDEFQKIVSRLESANVELQEVELNLVTILHNLEYITGSIVTISSGSTVKALEDNVETDDRFDIKALLYDSEAKSYSTKAEKSAYLPTISLNHTITYDDKDYRDDNALNGPYHQNISSANLNWNIFSFGETKFKSEAKHKEYLASKSNYDYEKNKASIDLKLSLKAYNIALAKIKSSEASVKAAQTAYEVIKSKFENGLIDNVAYLQSLTEKYDAISQHKQSLNDLEIKKAAIIYNSGEKIKEYIR